MRENVEVTNLNGSICGTRDGWRDWGKKNPQDDGGNHEEQYGAHKKRTIAHAKNCLQFQADRHT